MPYLFFLGPVPLPITPSALSIKTPSLNRTVTLVNEGEINIPKGAGLREISFEFLLPRVQKYPFANYHIPYYTATIMTKLLVKWKEMMLPFRFIVARTSPKMLPLDYEYIKCLVEEFTFDEDAEAHGLDVMCSITLKEYKDYGTKTIEVEKKDKDSKSNTAKVTKNRPTDSKQTQSSVTAKEGDTLLNIAKKETGSFANVDKIAEENGWVKLDLNDVPELALDPEDELRLWLKEDLPELALDPEDEVWLMRNDVPELTISDAEFDAVMSQAKGRVIATDMLNRATSAGTSTGGVSSIVEPISAGTKVKLPTTNKQSITPSRFSEAMMGGWFS